MAWRAGTGGGNAGDPAARFRRLLGDLAGLADDETLGAAELRKRLKRLITPFESERQGSQVAAIRQELGRKSQELGLLKLAREAPLAVPADHKLATAFAALDSLAVSPNALPATTAQPFGPSWQGLVDQPDRAAAAPEDKLIPHKLWQRDQGRFLHIFSAWKRG